MNTESGTANSATLPLGNAPVLSYAPAATPSSSAPVTVTSSAPTTIVSSSTPATITSSVSLTTTLVTITPSTISTAMSSEKENPGTQDTIPNLAGNNVTGITGMALSLSLTLSGLSLL